MESRRALLVDSFKKHIDSGQQTAVSVDCVIFGYSEDGLKVLTISCDMEPFRGKRSLLGELVSYNESIDLAAKRVLKLWTNLDGLYLEQVQAFGNPDRHPLGRVISIAYYALIPVDLYQFYNPSSELKWYAIDELNEMAFDHEEILCTCLKTLRKKIRQMPIGFSLLPEKFTLVQLQSLYESILGITLDKRNFRRKLNALDLLIDLEETEKKSSHRPAKLYSFNFDLYQKRKKKGTLTFDI